MTSSHCVSNLKLLRQCQRQSFLHISFVSRFSFFKTLLMKNALGGDANTARAEPKFCPAADPLPGGAGRPNFNQLEMVTTFTCKSSLVRIGARNFELSW